MRALVAGGYGPPGELAVAELPVPVPGPGQVLVRVAAAALNPADLRLLGGAFREAVPLAFPHVPGSDFAGEVVAVGPGGGRFAVGARVFGHGLPRAAGAMAEQAASPPSFTTGAMAEFALFESGTPGLAPVPEGLSPERAATLPIPGLTALALLREGRFSPGETVLVLGAAGGVGGALVPLLAAAGARVIGTAIPADAEYVRGLGAAEVLDYRSVDPAEEALRRVAGGVDALVNLALPGPALTAAARAVRPGGRVLNAAFPSQDPGEFARAWPRLTGRTVLMSAREGALAELAEKARTGVLPDTISRRYGLAEAPRAYADLAGRHVRGKLVVVM
ncbi:NADP-dependent oxidoreductase [Streptomyces hoynatensis]|uniref:NADP-dependent oxidoreductase n=2 Tax=Streptomyces hoynatensis TaxID=1141874 RepID=A0A3A9ZEG9_9ACTN|nr:NADP-dependent oxidoreductase [Streptomyces hoynatensis]